MELMPMKVSLDIGQEAHFACAYFNAEELHIDLQVFDEGPVPTHVPGPASVLERPSTEVQLGPSVRDVLRRFPWGGRRTLSVLVVPGDRRRVVCRVTNSQGLVMGQLTAPLIQQIDRLSSTGFTKQQ